MPYLIGLLSNRNAMKFATSGFVEQAKVNFLGMLGKKREIDALPVPSCAERIGPSRPDSQVCVFLR